MGIEARTATMTPHATPGKPNQPTEVVMAKASVKKKNAKTTSFFLPRRFSRSPTPNSVVL